MIRYFLVQNRQGRVRLSKWFVPYEDEEKQKLLGEIYRLVNGRHNPDDNELATLELIHLIVEILDAYFGNVCELHLVFGFHKLHAMLDELVIGGEIIETSKSRVLQRLEELEDLP